MERRRLLCSIYMLFALLEEAFYYFFKVVETKVYIDFGGLCMDPMHSMMLVTGIKISKM
jgi:hypothetical protein